MTQCTAKSKRTGERCRAQAVTGRNVCYHHGGKSPVGMAQPAFRTGRYSKYLPTRVLDHYQQALQDDELLATRESVALAEARIIDLLNGLEAGAGTALWEQAKEAFAALDGAIRAGNGPKVVENVRLLERIITAGETQSETWEEIGAWMERARKLRETEQRRLVAMQQVITSEQAMVLVAALTLAVKNHVDDPGTLRAITDDFTRTLSAAGTGILTR